MFCPKCGTKNPDDAKFCGGCGNNLLSAIAANQASAASAQPVATPAVQPAAATAPAAQFTAPAANPAPAQAAVASSGPITKRMIVVGAAAIVLIIALVLVLTNAFGCSASGYGSAEAAADSLESATKTYFTETFNGNSESAAKTYANAIVNGIHPKMLEALQDNLNVSSKDELVSKLTDTFSASSSSLDSYGSLASALASALDITIDLYPGDDLSSSTIEKLNKQLSSENIDITVSAGKDIDGSVTMAGQSFGSGDMGLDVVQIDGKWYYWYAA